MRPRLLVTAVLAVVGLAEAGVAAAAQAIPERLAPLVTSILMSVRAVAPPAGG